MSSTALAALEQEWGRLRWVWNECVHVSRKTHLWNRTRPQGAKKRTCGPAQLDRMLTEARGAMSWPREGASVPQQQIIRDFAKSRTKAHKDIAARLPLRQRTGIPKPKFLARTGMAHKSADAAIGATKCALIEMAAKHRRAGHLIDPKHTTMDCAHCGARAKHRLPLSERTYTCTACGVSSPRDKNSAHVMLIRAGLVPG